MNSGHKQAFPWGSSWQGEVRAGKAGSGGSQMGRLHLLFLGQRVLGSRGLKGPPISLYSICFFPAGSSLIENCPFNSSFCTFHT